MDARTWNKILKIKAQLTQEQFALLAKYKARSVYARNLESAPVSGLSKETSDGYFVMLRLSLAYTAIEMLDKATGNSHAIEIRSHKFTAALSAGFFDGLLEAIRKSTPANKKAKVEIQIEDLLSGNDTNCDLLVLMELSRHLMFHGAFSPNETSLVSSSRRRRLVSLLAFDALDAADSFLEKWVSKRVTKSKRAKNNRGVIPIGSFEPLPR